VLADKPASPYPSAQHELLDLPRGWCIVFVNRNTEEFQETPPEKTLPIFVLPRRNNFPKIETWCKDLSESLSGLGFPRIERSVTMLSPFVSPLRSFLSSKA